MKRTILKAGVRFWIVTVASVAALAATLALGSWQVSRAHEKLDLQAAIDERTAMPPLGEAELIGGASAQWLHRPVRLRGQWLVQHSVFLDNRQMQSKNGFYLVTPLRLKGSGKAVLVQRGWVPRNFSEREKLPLVETPTEDVEINGRLALPPSKLYEFDAPDKGVIRQNLDLSQFRLEAGLDLLDLTVQQLGEPSQGLLRDWPVVGSGAGKNYAYAVQWWALSALIVFLYVWFQFISPRRKARHAR